MERATPGEATPVKGTRMGRCNTTRYVAGTLMVQSLGGTLSLRGSVMPSELSSAELRCIFGLYENILGEFSLA